MTRNNSEVLKEIGGVLLIETQSGPKLCCIEDLMHTKHFTIGQLFHAVAVLNNKTAQQYGDAWPRYRNNAGDVSQDWEVLVAARKNCENDFEFINEVCSQLGEVPPAVIARSDVLKNLEKFRQGSL